MNCKKTTIFGTVLLLSYAALPLAPAKAQLANAPAPTVVDKDGYTVLFNGKDLAGWKSVRPDSWKVEEGILTWQKGAGDLWSEKRYGDFVLEVEFKVDKGTNSGVFIRTDDTKQWLHTGMEFQVMDSAGRTAGKHDTGALYDVQAPSKNTMKAIGEWNTYRINAKGPKLTVELNGEVINDIDLDRWTEAGKNPDGTPNKFKTAYKDMKRDGFIGLQDHGAPVWYRTIRLKELKAEAAK